MSKESTKDRILNAAEALFADRGFAETSLRTITQRADVNLASVNYHFGSKKSLIQAVFDRFFRGFVTSLDLQLKPLENDEQSPSIEQVLDCLVEPLLSINDTRDNGASNFMKLLGRAYGESQGHIRRFTQDNYAHYLQRFTKQIHRAIPELDANEMFWRLHFTLGTVIFTLGGGQALHDIAEAEFSEHADLQKILARLMPYLAAGLKA